MLRSFPPPWLIYLPSSDGIPGAHNRNIFASISSLFANIQQFYWRAHNHNTTWMEPWWQHQSFPFSSPRWIFWQEIMPSFMNTTLLLATSQSQWFLHPTLNMDVTVMTTWVISIFLDKHTFLDNLTRKHAQFYPHNIIIWRPRNHNNSFILHSTWMYQWYQLLSS